jgi:ribonuclease P protein component
MTERVPKLKSLAKRAQFLRVRGGARTTAPAFVLEAKRREPISDTGATGPLFGFTITKKIGNAVKRNLIRRRLKSALTELAPALADPTMDYVIVARGAAATQNFASLRSDLETALKRVHSAAAKSKRPPRPRFLPTSATSSAEMRSVACAFDPSTTRPDYSRDRNEQAPA